MPVLERPSPPRLEELMRRSRDALQGLAYRVLGDHGQAEEVVQDAFTKLAGSPLLDRPDGEVAAWLRRVTLNAAFNRARDERRARARVERAGRLEPGDASTDGDTPLRSVLVAEERAAVRRALARLPERQRAVLLLRASGYRYREVAATLEIATGSVGVLLARAERAFRRAYVAGAVEHGGQDGADPPERDQADGRGTDHGGAR